METKQTTGDKRATFTLIRQAGWQTPLGGRRAEKSRDLASKTWKTTTADREDVEDYTWESDRGSKRKRRVSDQGNYREGKEQEIRKRLLSREREREISSVTQILQRILDWFKLGWSGWVSEEKEHPWEGKNTSLFFGSRYCLEMSADDCNSCCREPKNRVIYLSDSKCNK